MTRHGSHAQAAWAARQLCSPPTLRPLSARWTAPRPNARRLVGLCALKPGTGRANSTNPTVEIPPCLPPCHVTHSCWAMTSSLIIILGVLTQFPENPFHHRAYWAWAAGHYLFFLSPLLFTKESSHTASQASSPTTSPGHSNSARWASPVRSGPPLFSGTHTGLPSTT